MGFVWTEIGSVKYWVQMHLKSMAGSTMKTQNDRLRDQGPSGEKVNRKTRQLFGEREENAKSEAASHQLPTAAARGLIPGEVMWDLWRTKWNWGGFPPSSSVFLKCSILILAADILSGLSFTPSHETKL
jgi:hypothetical protein